MAISKSLCNKALCAMQLKLTEVIRENAVTFHPVVSIIFSFKMFKLGTLMVGIYNSFFEECKLCKACICWIYF